MSKKDPTITITPITPEQSKSILQSITYGWMNPLFKLGYKRPLQHDDLWDLGKEYTSAEIGEVFDRKWREVVLVAEGKGEGRKGKVVGDGEENVKVEKRVGDDEKSLENITAGHNVTTIPSPPTSFPIPATQPRTLLLRTITTLLLPQFLISASYNFVSSSLVVLTPLLLRELVAWIKSGANATAEVHVKGVWYGLVLAIVFFLVQVVTTVLHNRSTELCMKMGYVLRTALIQMLFKKTFVLSGAARQQYTNGKIVNIMATDTNRMDLTCQAMHSAWSTPYQIVVAASLLLWVLGPSALLGFICFAAFLPVQGWFMRHLSHLRNKSNPYADTRVRTTQEVISGIRTIKSHSWEQSFLSILSSIRNKELKYILKASMDRGLTWALTQLVPTVAMLATFGCYWGTGHELDPVVVVPALALFYALRVPMIIMPGLLDQVSDAWVAADRIGSLLLASETETLPTLLPPSSNSSNSPQPAIKVTNATFTWEEAVDSTSKSTPQTNPTETDKTLPFTLNNITLNIPTGSITAIIGPVGSGKSSLLSALLGQMRYLPTSPTSTPPTFHATHLSYSSQHAWIQNATLRENILFSSPFHPEKYTSIVRACGLERDFQVLQNGDETEIGEKGINLSGGQKQRVALARCCYSDADVVLLDDPLSAVDAHVGNWLFEECLVGVLKGKTRVVATHQLHFLPRFDHIVVLDGGKIVEQGTFDELMKKGEVFGSLMREYGGASGDDEEDEDGGKESRARTGDEGATASSDDITKKEAKPKGLISVEDRDTGSVKSEYYKLYAKFCGGWPWISLIIFFVCFTQATRIATDNWLTWWSTHKFALTGPHYLLIYALLGIISGASIITQAALIAIAGTRAGKRIHEMALRSVLRAPLRFFDETPVGRIINRFSRDVDSIDNQLKESYRVGLFAFSMTIGNLIYIATIFPYFLLATIPALALYYLLQRYYRSTSRELRRLDSTSRSPLIAHYTETLSGLPTLRAFSALDRAQHRLQVLLDKNNQAYYLYIQAQRWLAVRLETLSSMLVLVASLFAVFGRENVGAAMAGLVLTYALQITLSFNSCTRQIADTETNMNSAERLLYYVGELPEERWEADAESKREVDERWPERGEVVFENVVMKYREDLEPVLKGISIKFNAGEKIGIVGRTGAGKSSILSTLLRLIEPTSGNIFIDGVDISKIDLHTLRSRIAIIPQEPVLFSGTIRVNLDPFGVRSDHELWDVLERTGLKEVVKGMGGRGLDTAVVENGENFSMGQRQLICLARAMLKKSKIIILDEATASVDFATDTLIQTAIRNDPIFSSATILTIAHRLNTVADYDKILVLSFGQYLEYDTPFALLRKSHDNNEAAGAFAKMVADTGSANAEVIWALASRAETSKETDAKLGM